MPRCQFRACVGVHRVIENSFGPAAPGGASMLYDIPETVALGGLSTVLNFLVAFARGG